MTIIVRPLRSGQITIPADFRKRLGIDADSLLQLTLQGDKLCIEPVEVMSDKKIDRAWLKSLYDHFSKVRDEAKSHSAEDIDKSIKKAVTAVRSSHD